MEKKIIELPRTNSVVRWMLFSSLILTGITLITEWLLWFNLDRDVIEKLLVFLQNDVFSLGFWSFSAIIFTFAGLVFLLSLPLIFIKRKNTANNIFSLLSLILALAIFGSGLFIIIFLINKSAVSAVDAWFFMKENLIVVIPFYLAMLFSLVVIITSLINLIVVKNKVKIKQPKLATKDLVKPVLVNNLKTNPKVGNIANNLIPKTLATIRVTVPASKVNNINDITDNIKVYQNNENVSLDFNISE